MTKVCDECGEPHKSKGRFCGTPCRQAFNNRRLQRGAQVYDLVYAMRYDRDSAKTLGVWAELCRVVEQWNQEDKAEHGGRKTYIPPKVAIANLKDRGQLRRATIYQTRV